MNYDAKLTGDGFERIWTRRTPQPTESIGSRLRARRAGVLLAVLGIWSWRPATAAQLDVEVHDRNDHPIADVVITLVPLSGTPHATAEHVRKSAVMDQINRQFVPQVLVVARGTAVEFPNSDAVSHQVYSFSAAKKFQLPLYKGAKPAPIVFDQAGLVVLGCNIHDSMIGYIVITDAAIFGKTNASGRFESPALPAGRYRVDAWSPRIAESVKNSDASLTREVSVDATTTATFHVQSSLRAEPEPRAHREGWDSY